MNAIYINVDFMEEIKCIVMN